MPSCRATPPMKATGPSRPTRLSSDSARSASELWMPRRMFSTVTPSETWLMISVSASTAHTLEIAWGRAAPSDSGPMSATDTSRYLAARSRKPPEPGGALLVHVELLDLAAVAQADRARALGADVQHEARLRDRAVAAPRAPQVRSVIWMSRKGTA